MQAMAWVIESHRPERGRPLPARPRHGIPPSPLVPVFLATAAVSLLIAVAFALAGAWLVLPFAGLELAGLAWALRRAARRRTAAVPPAPTFCATRMAASRSRRLPATRIRMINLRRKPF
jgi:hypothetical protein